MVSDEAGTMITIRKNQLIAIPPFTLVFVLAGEVIEPTGEVSMIFSKGALLEYHDSHNYYVRSEKATLLFITYKGRHGGAIPRRRPRRAISLLSPVPSPLL